MNHAAVPCGAVRRIDANEPFAFHCHRGVPCFTRCCHDLELGLTPYDVLRLRKATGLSSTEVLERFVIIEQDDDEPFPRLYLTMVDDGKASCVFLGPEGCSIYPDRPSSCRTYPLGRAVARSGDRCEEHFVLLQETHCQGFLEPLLNTPKGFLHAQDLAVYHTFNDLVAGITQHDHIRQGMNLTVRQQRAYLLALYDLDTFREKLSEGFIDFHSTPDAAVFDDDEALLSYALVWLDHELFACGSESRG
ncbi:YkgJ family cysteine cluster protein [Desulfofustis limnaeus]|uniref:Zinc/iron-chelating domain-containing protein n=1 Tax=Desulfofustis limnaeus TaxID=2740163 RepID=A0ABM7W4B5_9BACT|nr:YkgJ family cysteine cluster protein [Desulfofustis limnaeus]BDD85755.1 zinc/iron-chelating domain-containing protein [Desulfofustis limnaeus]